MSATLSRQAGHGLPLPVLYPKVGSLRRIPCATYVRRLQVGTCLAWDTRWCSPAAAAPPPRLPAAPSAGVRSADMGKWVSGVMQVAGAIVDTTTTANLSKTLQGAYHYYTGCDTYARPRSRPYKQRSGVNSIRDAKGPDGELLDRQIDKPSRRGGFAGRLPLFRRLALRNPVLLLPGPCDSGHQQEIEHETTARSEKIRSMNYICRTRTQVLDGRTDKVVATKVTMGNQQVK
ncbi:hypothetical protein LZ30DRAFT_795105 [Colletotrichum cereale]|nr:hypothetical protein LZ30DRAFT_795105 [Colletotrichum cereale]